MLAQILRLATLSLALSTAFRTIPVSFEIADQGMQDTAEPEL